MVFMAKMEKVLSDLEESSSSAEETIAEIVQICLWIIDSGCSKRMTSNRALLTNFVEKFLGTVRFGNNDFVVIAGYGDGLEVAFRKSTCFVQNEDGVDLLTGDHSSNLYTIALNEIASNSLACLLSKASSSQSWLWHQRLSHLNFSKINNLMKSNLVRGLLKMKFEKDHLCSTCEQGKIHRKHHKSKTDFASNKPLYLLYMDLCGPMRVKIQRVRTDNSTEFKNKTLAKLFDEVGITQQFSAARTLQENGVVERRNQTLVEDARTICYLLNDYDDVGKLKEKGDIGVFVGYSKESAAFRKKSSNPTVSQVSEISKKDLEDLFHNFYDEYFDSSKIMKSSTTNVATSNNEIPSREGELFHEVFESFQEESSSSSLNNDVQQSSEEVMVPSTNTQSTLNESVSNVNEASTSHNVFNEQLEDAYFDARSSTDPKSSIRTRGKLANSCLFASLLSSIEPTNMVEALKDADWGQFLKELCTNTFSGSDHKDANEHIEKVLEIVDLFHIPNITIDQVMLRAFPMSLTGAASRWLRNKPTGSITTWDGLKTKFLNKYCPPARITKKMEEINNFQQKPDENLYQAWEQFKELLMSILDSKAIQAQLNNLGREFKKVSEKVYAAQVGCEQCKGPHYTKDCPLKEEGKALKEAYYTKEKDPGSFTLPCFINNICYDNALVDLGAKVSVMPLSTYLNLGLGELAHTKLTVELVDRTMKYPKGIAKNVLVGIGKFVFLVDFIILDMPEDIKVPLILERPFLSTARAKIDVYKRNITLRVREEKIIFTSVKPASSLIKRVYMLCLREKMELDSEARLMGESLVLNRSLDPFFEDYIELYDLNEPFELRRNQGDDLMPTIEEGEVSEKDKMNGILHPYQKLKGFYKGVLNLGPDYIRDAKMEKKIG
ncbi:retrovirus-related pol polyprotein from transposon TNT 1-94 [Tanacetum coccineum]